MHNKKGFLPHGYGPRHCACSEATTRTVEPSTTATDHLCSDSVGTSAPRPRYPRNPPEQDQPSTRRLVDILPLSVDANRMYCRSLRLRHKSTARPHYPFSESRRIWAQSRMALPCLPCNFLPPGRAPLTRTS